MASVKNQKSASPVPVDQFCCGLIKARFTLVDAFCGALLRKSMGAESCSDTGPIDLRTDKMCGASSRSTERVGPGDPS